MVNLAKAAGHADLGRKSPAPTLKTQTPLKAPRGSPERLPSISPTPPAHPGEERVVKEELRAAKEERKRLMGELRTKAQAAGVGVVPGGEDALPSKEVLDLQLHVERLEFEHNELVDLLEEKTRQLRTLGERIDLDPLEREEDKEEVALNEQFTAEMGERTRQAEQDYANLIELETPKLALMLSRAQNYIVNIVRSHEQGGLELEELNDDMAQLVTHARESVDLKLRAEQALRETRETVDVEHEKRDAMLERRKKYVEKIKLREAELEKQRKALQELRQELKRKQALRLFQTKSKEFIEYTRRVSTEAKESELRQLFAALFGTDNPPPPSEVMQVIENSGQKTDYLRDQIEGLERREKELREHELPKLVAARDELAMRVHEPLSRADAVKDDLDAKMACVRTAVKDLHKKSVTLSTADSGIGELLRVAEERLAGAMEEEPSAEAAANDGDSKNPSPRKDIASKETAAARARREAREREEREADEKRKQARSGGLDKLRRGIKALSGNKGLAKGGLAALTGAASLLLAKKQSHLAEAQMAVGPGSTFHDLDGRFERLGALLERALEVMAEAGMSEEDLRLRSAEALTRLTLGGADAPTPFRTPWGEEVGDSDAADDEVDGGLSGAKSKKRSVSRTSSRKGRKPTEPEPLSREDIKGEASKAEMKLAREALKEVEN